MKKIIFAVFAFLIFTLPAIGQYAYRVAPVAALPATCNPANGEVRFLTAGAGISPALYTCTATNTWRTAGIVGNGLVINQGTLTASLPVFNHTATWNNAAAQFVNFRSNITNTASLASSFLLQLQVDGVDMFTVSLNGTIRTASNLKIAPASYLSFEGRTRLRSSADGVIRITNDTENDFTRLSLGPEAVTHPGITIPPAVAGQAQGIIITRSDGTNQTFAGLGAATNGSMIYCADCTIASPCAAGGTGAIAKRLNGVWVCN
jgi:hypothetical protein